MKKKNIYIAPAATAIYLHTQQLLNSNSTGVTLNGDKVESVSIAGDDDSYDGDKYDIY